MVTFAAHTEIVTATIDHKGLENVAIVGGRLAEGVKKRSNRGRRKRGIGVDQTDRENGWTVSDFLPVN